MKKEFLKTLIIGLVILLVISLLLMLFGQLDPLYFWVLIIITGVFAYWILPRIKK